MIDFNKEPAKLVTFGKGGDTVHYTKGASCQGYGSPDNPHAADPATKIIPDGTPVIDKTKAVETPEGYAWAFKGPMVNVDLAPGEVDALDTKGSMVADAVSVNGGAFAVFVALQRLAENGRPQRGCLDSVSIPEYILGWAERGARIGHYEGGKIVWHDNPTAAPKEHA